MVIPPWYEIPPSGYGGIEVVCGALVNALSARGHEVTVFGAGRRTGTAAARFVSTIDEPQHARMGEAMPAVLHAARVEALLRGGQFDVVHDHSPCGPLTAEYRAAPTVVTVHGAADGELGDFYQELGDTVSLVAISDSQRSRRPELPWVATVHNAVEPADFVPSHTPGGPVLWLARMSPDKGPDLAIKACRAAGLPLVLAGKCLEAGEARYFEDVIRPMLSSDVRVFLNADRATTQRLTAQARCLLLPNRWHEPFGMVMVEAMASGTPVVALRRGSVPEVVVDGVTGWICDDLGALPDALRRVGELSPDDCVARVRDAFGADLMARRYEKVFRMVMARTVRTPVLSLAPPVRHRPGTMSGAGA
jgi:glycosyltransferase involved in cell wall biosynthesis